MNKPTKENTLYLPIKQVYFDAILKGEKKTEIREVKEGVTASRYLIKDGSFSGYVIDRGCTIPNTRYFIDDYNGGKFPFLPRPYKYLYLAVGYSKQRDTAIVAIDSISFHPERIRCDSSGNPLFCFWSIVFHIGKVMKKDCHRNGNNQ